MYKKARQSNATDVYSVQEFRILAEIKYHNRDSLHNHVYTIVPIKDDKPDGKQFRLKFSNLFSPNEIINTLQDKTRIIVNYKQYKYTNSVTLWRFADNELHELMTKKFEYKLMYDLQFKADVIEAIKDYNENISKRSNWLLTISGMTIDKIENDPWDLIEWEEQVHELGLSKDSKKHINLKMCDKIGMILGLPPNYESRLVQYCVNSMREMCFNFGSTIVYYEPFLKYTVDFINQSEFNRIEKYNANINTIRRVTKGNKRYFFVGKTQMHNNKLFISSRSIWDAQEFIIEKLYELVYPMNTPYYAEREMLLGYCKGKGCTKMLNFDVLRNIMSKMIWFNENVEHHLQKFMETFNLNEIDDIQRKSIHTTMNENVSIISGGPGRGKSSCCLKAILYVFDQLYKIPRHNPLSNQYHLDNMSSEDKKWEKLLQKIPNLMVVHVLSFTGKAVSRIKEVLQPAETVYYSFEPMTMHRLLYRFKVFKWLKKVPSILVIDEVSMVSDVLFYDVLKQIENIKKIVFLGDIDQLPPIQPGNMLKEIIESRCLPVTRLVKNYRQGAGSGLPDIADKIIGRTVKEGRVKRFNAGWDHALNKPTKKDKSYVTDMESIFGPNTDDCRVYSYPTSATEDTIFEDIAKVVLELRQKNGYNLMNDCVVLTAKRVEFAKLNVILQPVFMKDYEKTLKTSPQMTHYYEGIPFKILVGDRIMYLENNYEKQLFNGDIGFVTDIGQTNVNIYIPDLGLDGKGAADELQPAYSYTTHKSQGSEFKIVIIYISKNANMLHLDQWLYTAFTRARQKVYIFGYSDEIIQTVLREMKHRRTFLKHRIQLKFSHQLNDLIKDELQDLPQ